MLNNLTKLAKFLTRKSSVQQVLFHFSMSVGSIKILKNPGQYKICLEINLCRKNEHFAKYFLVCKFF